MKSDIAFTKVSRPYFSTSSTMRAAPRRAAEIAAHMSPSRKSGRRLLHFMIAMTGSIGVPSSMILTAGRRRPSWKSCFASLEIEPGTMPPTSFQCAMFAVHATRSPPAKTGSTKITSLRCVTPP